MPPAPPTHSTHSEHIRALLAACFLLRPPPPSLCRTSHGQGPAAGAPPASRYLQHKLVGLTQLAGVLLVALEALHLLPIRGVQQELLDVRRLQAVRLHRHEDLAQLHVRELEVGDQDGCREGRTSAGPGGGPALGMGCLAGWGWEGKRNLCSVRAAWASCAHTDKVSSGRRKGFPPPEALQRL